MSIKTITGTNNDDDLSAIGSDIFVISARAGDDQVTISAENSHTINLGKGDDTFLANVTGDPGASGNVSGGGGDDLFDVATLSTFFDGGDGDDAFLFRGSQLGFNQYDGGAGRDTVDFSGFAALGPGLEGLSVNLQEATISTSASSREALISIESFIAGDFDDELTGSSKGNLLDGRGGDDVIDGGAGNDTIVGGVGLDQLSGGEGADVFLFRKVDLPLEGEAILDFSHQDGDLLDFSRIDANRDVSGKQPLRFIGDDAFAGAGRGQIRVTDDGNIQVDVDGNGSADFSLGVETVNDRDLARDDFIL